MIAIVSNMRALQSSEPDCNLSTEQRSSLQTELFLAQREGHRALHGDFAVNPRRAFETPHPAAQPEHFRFDDHHVARMNRTPISYAFNTREERQPPAVLR